MSFTIKPISGALGAEVHGLDLRQPLDQAAKAAILDAWHEHMLLLFRDQNLTQDQQLAFASTFGSLGVRKRKPEDRPEGADYDHVMMVTNIRRDGVPIGSLPDGEMFFHHDMCYVEAPHSATMLYSIEVPSQGGDTLIANMCNAYDTLPEDIKARIEGRKVVQVYNYLPTVQVDPEDDFGKYNHRWQPAVIVHPVTGRKALYINELMSVRIDGLSAAESRETLEAIWAHTKKPDNVYAHDWAPGDLLMWDNRSTCHARTDFPETETRLLRRCTVVGEPLIAA